MPVQTSNPHFNKGTFGTCAYDRTQPARDTLTNATKILNIHLSFEEALKLGLAIDECLRQVNRYNKAKNVGKQAGLNVAVHLDQGRISIHEGKVYGQATKNV